jgi:hypothetical protein
MRLTYPPLFGIEIILIYAVLARVAHGIQLVSAVLDTMNGITVRPVNPSVMSEAWAYVKLTLVSSLSNTSAMKPYKWTSSTEGLLLLSEELLPQSPSNPTP